MSKKDIKRSITITDIAISFGILALGTLAVVVILTFLPMF